MDQDDDEVAATRILVRQPEQPEQRHPGQTPPGPAETSATVGRPAFKGLKRALNERELGTPGVQKLLLEMLEAAESERDEYRRKSETYVDKFHEANTNSSLAQEKLKRNLANEIMTGVGTTLGGIVLGFATSDKLTTIQSVLCIGVGVVLVIGAAIGRIASR
jgi:hypothetical protein